MKKWMKVIGSVMVAALVVTVFAGVALAQGPNDDGDGTRDLNGTGHGPAWGFVDEDGDGVNDRYTEDCEFVDEDGDGVCDSCGREPGEGYDQGHHGNGQANGAQGRGNSQGTRLMDGSGHGECDGNPDNAQAMGRGKGRGRRATGQ